MNPSEARLPKLEIFGGDKNGRTSTRTSGATACEAGKKGFQEGRQETGGSTETRRLKKPASLRSIGAIITRSNPPFFFLIMLANA